MKQTTMTETAVPETNSTHLKVLKIVATKRKRNDHFIEVCDEDEDITCRIIKDRSGDIRLHFQYSYPVDVVVAILDIAKHYDLILWHLQKPGQLEFRIPYDTRDFIFNAMENVKKSENRKPLM